MKLKNLAVASAAALAVPMAAHAVAPTGPYDTAGAMRVYLSGASALDNNLDFIMGFLLKPGTFYKYTVGTDYRLYLGELAATNQKILFVKRSKGGSAWGVNPIGNPNPANRLIQTMDLNSIDCPTAAVAGILSSPGAAECKASAVKGNDPGFSGNPGSSEVPDFGVSDVAPFMFKEPFNVEFGAQQLNDTSNMTIKPVNAMLFGPVATAAVPDTLKISNADYHAMLTASVFDWKTIGLTVPAGDLKTGVVVCRLVPGSGTQAVSNWYFNNFPCSGSSLTSGVSGFTTPTRMSDSFGFFGFTKGTGDGSSAANAIGVDVTAGYTVIEGVGSGDVRKCLTAANNKTEYNFVGEDGLHYAANFQDSPAGDTVNAGYRAIGILSLDSQYSQYKSLIPVQPNGNESAWFYRTLDGNGRFYADSQTCLVGATISQPGTAPVGGTDAKGVCPNQNEMRTGSYVMVGELYAQYLTTASKDSFDSARRSFENAFISAASNPGNQLAYTMALPGGAYTPNGTNAVAYASRSGNQCGPLVRFTY